MAMRWCPAHCDGENFGLEKERGAQNGLFWKRGISRTGRSIKSDFIERAVLENPFFQNEPFWKFSRASGRTEINHRSELRRLKRACLVRYRESKQRTKELDDDINLIRGHMIYVRNCEAQVASGRHREPIVAVQDLKRTL